MLNHHRIAAPALLIVALAGCGEPPPAAGPQCGPATTLVDGVCVSTLTPTVCGEGTVLDEATGECVPTTACGPGTTFDPVTQTCVGDATCAPGTTLDPATGECRSDVACGDGTVYDAVARLCRPAATCPAGTILDDVTFACLPVNICGEGTIRNTTTNLCDPEILCGPGLVVDGGRCVSADDQLLALADAIEPGNDQNDPAFGGTPEALTLEGPGESVVFSGTIGRAVDLDDDTDLDQDRDFWSFDGIGGTTLRIRLLSFGLPQPAFRVTGPDGYLRESRAGELEPVRELVLPTSGAYTIEVVPLSSLGGGGPLVGSPDHGYVGVIEEIAFPTSRDLVLSPLPTFTEVTGSVLDLTDNAVHLRGGAQTGAQWTATVPTAGIEAVVMVFSANRVFQRQLAFSSLSGQRQPLLEAAWLEAQDDAIILLDWVRSDGDDATFSVLAAALPTTDIGTAAPDAITEASRVVLPGQFGRTFTFAATAGQVINSTFIGLGGTRAILVGPAGIIDAVTSLPRAGHDALVRTTGAHTWVVVNTTTSDVSVSPGIVSVTPIDAGLLGAGDARTFAGDALRLQRRIHDRVVVLGALTGPSVARLGATFRFGTPDIDLLRVNPVGALVDRRSRSDESVVAVAMRVDEASQVVAILDQNTIDPPDPTVLDWTMTLEGIAEPATREVEPNDDNVTATVLPAGPTAVVGSTLANQVDRFAVTLDAPLAAGEAIEARVHNLTQTNATFLRIVNDAGTVLTVANETLVTGALIQPSMGAGPFFLEVQGTGTTEYDYLLTVRPIVVNTEREPNDSAGAATALDVSSGFPVEVVGTTRSNEQDHFSFTLPAPLPAGTGLLIRARNEIESDDLDVTLRTGTTVLGTSRAEDAQLIAATGSNTSFTVQVGGRATTRTDTYRLTIDTIGPVEAEPNNSFAQATALALTGSEPVSVVGQDVLNGVDFYRITPDAPLAAGQSYAVRWVNMLERGDIEVTVFAETQEPFLLNEDYANEIVFSPVGSAGPFFVSVKPVGSGANVRPEPYTLSVQRIDVVGDLEPNDTIATAQALTSGVQVRAQSRSLGSGTTGQAADPDVFAVTVGPSGTVAVDVRAIERADDVSVTVTDAAGAVLAAGVDLDVALEVSAAAGSQVFVDVRSTQADAREFRVYTIVATSD